tara:strand:- start:118 stop:396 length:279 start_codon:yes stop_codon:yes gene_type:complete
MAEYNNDEKVFADGFSFKRQENAPDFVVGRLSVKCDEAVAFMKSHQKNGWLNLNIKYAQSGKPYVELDTWQPTKKTEAVNEPVAQASDDLPF